MTKRDQELKDILDKLAEFKQRYGIRSISMSILGDGRGQVHGYDGKENIFIVGNYKDIKNETLVAGTTREI